MESAAGCLFLSVLVNASVFAALLAGVAWCALRVTGRSSTPAAHVVWTALQAGMLFYPFLAWVMPGVPVALLPELSSAARDGFRVAVGVSYYDLLFWSYLAVATALGARLLAGAAALRRLVATATPLDGRLAERAGARLLVSPALSAPMTTGLVEPTVLLPRSWEAWDDERLAVVLAHELAHVRRRDPATRLLAQVTVCLYWFHPLAWRLARRTELLAELAADDAGVAACGDGRRYARHVLDLAGDASRRGALVEAGALGLDASGGLSTRLDSILDRSRAREVTVERRRVLAIALAALVAWGALAPLRLVAARPADTGRVAGERPRDLER